MTRPLLAALVLRTPAANAAENLDVAPIGTAVTGAFELGGKLIPLPEGKFVLAARTVSAPPMLGSGDISKPRPQIAHVFLAQIEPCKKQDALYRADLTGSPGEDENCLLVDHVMPNFGPRAQGIWKDAGAWLVSQNVQLPVGVMITANVTRSQRSQFVAAAYSFNPRMYGCKAPISRSWAESPWHRKAINEDPQRVRFVESVTAGGQVVQPHSTRSLPAENRRSRRRRQSTTARLRKSP
ncbi:MAG TPA: hypothetical protein VE085_13560 [Burkholderiales bacterium]|nr:hypothetical protein [Burkholderiales bacterium]